MRRNRPFIEQPVVSQVDCLPAAVLFLQDVLCPGLAQERAVHVECVWRTPVPNPHGRARWALKQMVRLRQVRLSKHTIHPRLRSLPTRADSYLPDKKNPGVDRAGMCCVRKANSFSCCWLVWVEAGAQSKVLCFSIRKPLPRAGRRVAKSYRRF